MTLQQGMQLFERFCFVVILIEAITFIVYMILSCLNKKHLNGKLEKYVELLDAILRTIDKPVTVIVVLWLVMTFGALIYTMFIK